MEGTFEDFHNHSSFDHCRCLLLKAIFFQSHAYQIKIHVEKKRLIAMRFYISSCMVFSLYWSYVQVQHKNRNYLLNIFIS